MSDTELQTTLVVLATRERTATVALLRALEEFDRRRLYLPLGYSSLFTYCCAELHLSEGAAFRRIEVARAARRFPVLLDMLRDGRLSLATACLVAPKLEPSTARDLFAQVEFKSKREVESILATRHPRPPVPSGVRKLPAVPAPRQTSVEHAVALDSPPALGSAAAPAMPSAPLQPVVPASRRPVVAPLSEAHYKLQVTISAKAHERLRQIQDLMRHRLPSGDPAAIVEHALEVLHDDLLKKKAAEVVRPRSTRGSGEVKGRYVPAAVKRAVWRRDEGRCAFVGEGQKRCGATAGLEYHHVQPFATGGEATVDNIEMRCRAHNGFEWQQHLDGETRALVER